MAKSARARFAVCIDSSGYPASLERHKIYRVLIDRDAAQEGDLRVVDESGEDYSTKHVGSFSSTFPRARCACSTGHLRRRLPTHANLALERTGFAGRSAPCR